MDEDFGARLRRARRQAGMSQRTLAERSGVHQPTIAAIETGRRSPGGRTRSRLEAAVRVRPSVVLERNRHRIREAIERHHGSDVRVFGSVARGDDTPESDLDLIVTFPDGTDLLDILDLTDELEALVGVPVHIASGRAAGPAMERARQEAVPL